mmetsp:Transcript_100213/g.283753  ORF Transcript_100213/g.283753 Transcript_100213/m.283753 type:complete len:271 (+) Transcript_100213:89-901(+)
MRPRGRPAHEHARVSGCGAVLPRARAGAYVPPYVSRGRQAPRSASAGRRAARHRVTRRVLQRAPRQHRGPGLPGEGLQPGRAGAFPQRLRQLQQPLAAGLPPEAPAQLGAAPPLGRGRRGLCPGPLSPEHRARGGVGLRLELHGRRVEGELAHGGPQRLEVPQRPLVYLLRQGRGRPLLVHVLGRVSPLELDPADARLHLELPAPPAELHVGRHERGRHLRRQAPVPAGVAILVRRVRARRPRGPAQRRVVAAHLDVSVRESGRTREAAS